MISRIARIHSFDLLRGYFLLVILIDHLAYFPSGFEVLTGRGLLYVSSAEGFFLISGIILGIVRGSKLIEKPFRIGAKLLLKRSLQLYVTSVVLTLLFTFIAWLFYMHSDGLKYGVAPITTSLPQLLWQTLTYQYVYGWADFLRFYTLFIAAAPIALWLLRRGRWYVVMAASLVVWWLYRLSPGEDLWEPLAWQLVFFSGFVIGFHWPQIVEWWHQIHIRWRNRIGIALLISFIVTAGASALLVFGDMLHVTNLSTLHRAIEPYFNKDSLPLPRLALGTIWFWGLFWLVRRYEAIVIKRIGWLLLPFGENSLYVYTIEAFVIFFFHIYLVQAQPVEELAPWYINFLLTAVAISIVWFMTRQKVLFKIIPR